MRHQHVAARDRLHAVGARGLVELDQSERVGEVRERQRGHAFAASGGDGIVDACRAVDHRVLAVEAEMDEDGRAHEDESAMLVSFYSVPSSFLTPPMAHSLTQRRAVAAAARRAAGAIVVAALLALTGCATVPPPRPKTTPPLPTNREPPPPNVNLSGFPLP